MIFLVNINYVLHADKNLRVNKKARKSLTSCEHFNF